MTALDFGPVADLFVTNVLNGTVAGNGNVVHGGTVVRLVISTGNGEGLDGAAAQNQVHRESDLPRVLLSTVIGPGFAERTDTAALVIGPTGVGFSRGNLYVADSLNNRIAAIPHAAFRFSSAGTGTRVSQNPALNDPLGLTIAPNGDILTVNGNDGNMIETTPGGIQFMPKLVDATGNPPGAGTLFGLAVAPGGSGVYFVDDGSNTLNLLH